MGEPIGALGAGLTDEELTELHQILYEYCFYGEDAIVYSSAGDTARAIMGKVEHEAKKRKLWWAS